MKIKATEVIDNLNVSVALQSSTTALKNPLTPSVVVSGLVVTGETSSDTFLIAHEELPAPGFSLAPEGRC